MGYKHFCLCSHAFRSTQILLLNQHQAVNHNLVKIGMHLRRKLVRVLVVEECDDEMIGLTTEK